jgi:uncharacterized protein
LIIAACRFTALAPESGSLKAKRKVLRSLKDRIKNRFNVSVAEVGAQNLWQRLELGLVAVGNDEKVLNSKMDKLLNYIESTDLVDIVSAELEFIHLTPEGF